MRELINCLQDELEMVSGLIDYEYEQNDLVAEAKERVNKILYVYNTILIVEQILYYKIDKEQIPAPDRIYYSLKDIIEDDFRNYINFITIVNLLLVLPFITVKSLNKLDIIANEYEKILKNKKVFLTMLLQDFGIKQYMQELGNKTIFDNIQLYLGNHYYARKKIEEKAVKYLEFVMKKYV